MLSTQCLKCDTSSLSWWDIIGSFYEAMIYFSFVESFWRIIGPVDNAIGIKTQFIIYIPVTSWIRIHPHMYKVSPEIIKLIFVFPFIKVLPHKE